MDPKLPEDFQPVAKPFLGDPGPKGANAPEPSAGMNESIDAQLTESISSEEAGLNSAAEPDAGWEEFSEEAIEDSDAAEEPPEAKDASPAEPATESEAGNSPEDKQAGDPDWAERLLDLLESEVKAQDRTANSGQSPQAKEGEMPTDIIHGPIDNSSPQPLLRQPSGTIELPLPSDSENTANASSVSDEGQPGAASIDSQSVTIVQGQNNSEVGQPLPRIYVAVELLYARQLFEQARHDTAQLLQNMLVKIADERIDLWFWKRSSSERASDRFGR